MEESRRGPSRKRRRWAICLLEPDSQRCDVARKQRRNEPSDRGSRRCRGGMNVLQKTRSTRFVDPSAVAESRRSSFNRKRAGRRPPWWR